MIPGKVVALLVAAVIDVSVLASEVLDINAILNVVTLALIVVAAVPVLRSRRKDAIIKDLETALRSKDERVGQLDEDLKGAQHRANLAEEAVKHMRVETEGWKARYDEQAKYTAKGAVTHLEQMLVQHTTQVAARHERMLTALDALTDKIVGADAPPQ